MYPYDATNQTSIKQRRIKQQSISNQQSTNPNSGQEKTPAG